MNKGFRHMWLPGCVAALLMTSGWANGAVFTIEVVDVSGSTPANPVEVTVDHGDTLILEFFFADWDPVLLRGYQFKLAENGFSSGGGGPLELTSFACTINADCFGGSLCLDGLCTNGLRCDYPGGSCRDLSECLEDLEGDFCDCYASVFIDEDDPNFVFPPIGGPVLFTDCTTSDAIKGGYREVGVTLSPVPDPGVHRYVGTILVTVPSDACGDYTISFNPNPSYTSAYDSDYVPIPLDVSATIVIHAPECELEIESSAPLNCAIDARQPHALNDEADRFGWDELEITFNRDPGSLTPIDIRVTQTPNAFPFPPSITSVTPIGGNAVRLDLNKPINPDNWTCFALADDADQEVCIGYLPGDVNGENDALADDIPVLINHLNGGVTRPLYSVDIDRDGEAGPADILRVIDLLNGAADFSIWLGESLPNCPSAPE